METCVVSDNYFRSVTSLPPAPYPEGQPSHSALEWTSPEDLTLLAQLKVDSVNRLLDQPEMYHEPAYTQRIHHPCDNGYSFSSYRKDATHFNRSTVDTGITFLGAKSTTQITKYKWIHH